MLSPLTPRRHASDAKASEGASIRVGVPSYLPAPSSTSLPVEHLYFVSVHQLAPSSKKVEAVQRNLERLEGSELAGLLFMRLMGGSPYNKVYIANWMGANVAVKVRAGV